MYYVRKLDTAFVISFNRLDRNNRSQTVPILGLVQQTLESLAPPKRAAYAPYPLPGAQNAAMDSLVSRITSVVSSGPTARPSFRR